MHLDPNPTLTMDLSLEIHGHLHPTTLTRALTLTRAHTLILTSTLIVTLTLALA